MADMIDRVQIPARPGLARWRPAVRARYARSLAVGLLLPFLLAACVTGTGNNVTANNDEVTPPVLPEDTGPNDPFERVNRAIFGFNQQVDQFIVEPVSVAYVELTPEPVREAVTNALRNLGLPLSAIHSLLQGKFAEAGHTAERFVSNSVTLWMNDLHRDMPYPDEDAGQTLAVAGVDSGPFLMLPLLGPSNVRDALGRIVDSVIDPVGLVIGPTGNIARTVTDGVDTRARLDDQLDTLEATSLDFYATIRSLYNQNREALIRDGEVDPVHVSAPTVVVDLEGDFGDDFSSGFTGSAGAVSGDPAADDTPAVVAAPAPPAMPAAGPHAEGIHDVANLMPPGEAIEVGAQGAVPGTAEAPERADGNAASGTADDELVKKKAEPSIPTQKKLGIDVDFVSGSPASN